uniref:Uncharacterized protein n=1 Tax=Setaria digitata TaxID=48799 RepID=A0A915PQA4_9BILA
MQDPCRTSLISWHKQVIFYFFDLNELVRSSNKATQTILGGPLSKCFRRAGHQLILEGQTRSSSSVSSPCHKNHCCRRKFQGKNWKISRFEDEKEREGETTVSNNRMIDCNDHSSCSHICTTYRTYFYHLPSLFDFTDSTNEYFFTRLFNNSTD